MDYEQHSLPEEQPLPPQLQFQQAPAQQPVPPQFQQSPVQPPRPQTLPPTDQNRRLLCVAAQPLPLPLQRSVRYRLGKAEVWFTVLLALCVIGMLLNSVASSADGAISPAALLFSILVTVLSIVWVAVVQTEIRRKPKQTDLLCAQRVNEVYERGVVSTGAFGRVVLEWKDVTALYESEEMFLLIGTNGVVVWSAADLGGEAASVLRSVLLTHIPAGTLHQKGTIRPRLLDELPVPTVSPFPPALATVTARRDLRASATSRFLRVNEWGVPFALWMAAAVANVVADLFLMSGGKIVLRVVMFVLAVAVYALLTWLFCVGEQRTLCRKKGAICAVHILADGLLVADGANLYFITKEQQQVSLKTDAMRLELNDGVLQIPLAEITQNATAKAYFGL